MTEKLLAKTLGIIQMKDFTAACTSRLAALDTRSPLDNLA